MDKKSIMVIAGEASGDLHASNLVKEIRKLLPETEFLGIGGHRMQEAGVRLLFENHALAVTGFSEVLAKIGSLSKAYRTVKETLRHMRPDLLILLDFPDFNLRVADVAKRCGIPVLYYISPQVWAWRKNRIRKIRKRVDKIMVVLPFEASLYGDKGIFVGHPLLDEIPRAPSPRGVLDHLGIRRGSPVITLLPGSRKNEVRRLLPAMVEAAHRIQDRIPEVQYLLPVAPTIPDEEIDPVIRNALVPILPVRDSVYEALSISDFVIVASGTASLETAFFGVPMVILYRMSAFTYFLAKRLVRVPHIGLINMIAGKRIVPELVQDEVTPTRITRETLRFMQDSNRARRTSMELKEAVSRLGGPGASARAAAIACDIIQR